MPASPSIRGAPMSNLPTAADSPAEAVAREDGVAVFDPAAHADLGTRLSPGSLTPDPDVVDAHPRDEDLICPREGAIALVRADSTQDVQELVRCDTEHRVPRVQQSAKSRVSRGANGEPGAIRFNVSKQKDIVAANGAERRVSGLAAIMDQALNVRLPALGFTFAPDPG